MEHPAAVDLREVVTLGLARGEALLTAGEALVARRMLALEGEPAVLYARLTARVGEVFPVDTLDPGWEALVAVELCDHLVPWRLRAEASTVAELRAGCAALGLPVGGRRDALVERLAPRRGWCGRRWLRVRHRGLLRRLERWAFLEAWPDRSKLVVERLGHVRWPEYPITRGAALFDDRAALLRWEALTDGLEALDADACLEALEQGETGPSGRLDRSRALRRRVVALGREAERGGEPAVARGLYQRLARCGAVPPGRIAVRVARTLEAEGRAADALAVLEAARGLAGPVDRIAIGRAGRRLARSLRRGFAPDPPLRVPRERHLRLERQGTVGPRPGWRAGDEAAPIEPAVVHALEEAGRVALLAEGGLWTTLFALLFADTYFEPVPGMLPVRWLSGPLDVGSSRFAGRRAASVRAVLDAVDAGEAPARVRAAHARWDGVRLAGASWNASASALASVAEGIGPRGLRAVIDALLAGGFRAARGLPDLVVLPGEEARLDAHPGKLPSGLLLVEVKGPTDSVRDEQAVWFDRLLAADVQVELWKVGPG